MRTASQLPLISTQEGAGGVLWLGDIHFPSIGNLPGIGPALSLASPPVQICTRRPRNSAGGRCFPLRGIETKMPNPGLFDDENPEWTDEMFARSVPFSGLPQDLQTLLSGEKHVKPDAETPSKRRPAA